MRQQMILPAAFAIMVSWQPGMAASDAVWSYSMEEMYRRAEAFVELAQKKEGGNAGNIMAAEFKGYIGAALDDTANNNDRIGSCVRRHSVARIAYRAATIITGNQLDRAKAAPVAVHTALQFACKESYWQ